MIEGLNQGSILRSAGEAGELDLIDATLLSFIDGEAELGEIARQMALPLDEAIAIAARLIERGVLASGDGAVAISEERGGEIELDPLRRSLVDSTYAQLGSASLYEILEISPDADVREVREAYFRLSKLFHPDTLFGKELGPYREKMEAIFRQMTSAYEVLGRRKRRAEYDARLGEQRLGALRQKMLGGMDGPSDAAPDEVPDAARERVGARRQLDLDARRRLAAKRLSGGLRSSLRPPPSRADGAAATKPGGARDAADALLRSIDSRSSGSSGKAPVEALASRAMRAEEEGKFEEALNQWLAIERAEPEWPGLAQKLDDLRAVIARANLSEYRSLAAAHLRAGRVREAAFVYQRICAGAPEDVEAHLTAASIFRKMEPPDLRSARDFAQRAQALDPGRLSIRILLIRIYIDAGMKRNAIRYLDELLAEHPDDPEAQALQRELIGG